MAIMTPTPPSTTSSSAGGQSPDAQYRVVRKRNRVPLSCAPCRHRKLKCNRAHPCENCIKRGDANSCAYAAPATRKKNPSNQSNSSSDEMQNRIDRLEGLVLSLMTNGAGSASPSAANAALSATTSTEESQDYLRDQGNDEDDMIREESDGDGEGEAEDGSEIDGVTKHFGYMKVDGSKSFYVSESHWASILSDISEVKNYFNDHKLQYEQHAQKLQAHKGGDERTGPNFLFGAGRPPPRAEIFSSLPERTAADKLVTRFFNSYDPAIHIIHSPTFQKEYERHWQSPTETGLVWLGTLFAIMHSAILSYTRAGDAPPEYAGTLQDTGEVYRKRAVDCLNSANISVPVPGMIETLILHLQGEFVRSRDADLGIWLVIGVVVRLSMRMGYHRDPKPFPSVSPFQGEIRRRVWTFVRQMDTLLSFQMGLPSMIRSEDCDTELPRNLYDDEFWEGMNELPPSRPPSEPTPISYMITKAKLATLFGKIVENASCLRSPSYDTVMEFHQQLVRIHDTMPPHLRMQPIEHSVTDPANLIMHRYNLDLLYLKSQCVLHRKFVCYARQNPRFLPSKRACVLSSMELLSHQATLHRESRPTGRLRSLKWFISSLTTHDFLLAAMIVSLDLYYSPEAADADEAARNPFSWDIEQRTRMIRALETSLTIWHELQESSMDAFKAAAGLSVLLEKIKRPRATAPPAAPRTPNYGAMDGLDEAKPEHSAAMTLGMLSSGGVSNTPSPGFTGASTSGIGAKTNPMTDPTTMPSSFGIDNSGFASGGANPMNSLFDGATDLPTSLDWDAWDSYVAGMNLDANQVWPVGLDMPLPGPGDPIDPLQPQPVQGQSQRQGQQQQQQQQQQSLFNNAGNVFMGVNSPRNP